MIAITLPAGIEAEVCAEIAKRAELGLAKYGTSVADNPAEMMEWLQHLKEELLDAAIYVARAQKELESK